MNDHPTHDGPAPEPDPAELARIELASAYVDGDVDAVQRAEVEASPQLMDIVAALRQVRGEVADLPPVDELSRRRAIDAALAEFDLACATPAAAAATAPAVTAPNVTAPNVVPFRQRTRWTRVLGAAAAVAAIGVVGIAAINGMQGSDSKSSSMAPAQADGSIPAGATTEAGKGSSSTIGSIGAPASARVEVDTPAQLLTVSDQYDTATSSSGGGTSPATATTVFATVDTVDTVTTTVAAGATTTAAASGPDTSAGSPGAVSTAVDGTSVPGTATTHTVPVDSRSNRPTLPCPLQPTQEVIAFITYRGVDAAAVLDTASGTISAIDAQCHVLATVHR